MEGGNSSPTPTLLPSNTATPAAPPTPTLTFTSTATVTPFPTFISMAATTPTPTQQWLACPGIVVTSTDTDKGDMLHVLRCEDGVEYDMGPLAKGLYAVGPNDKFLVYVALSGVVYASRIGDPSLHLMYDLEREQIFTVFNKGVTPDFKISFVEDESRYKLVLIEKRYDQKRVYELPSWVTR
jgi:hypothetical protein